MPTEGLKRALLNAKVKGAEEDLGDVLSRMFEIPRDVALRVAYAALCITDVIPGNWANDLFITKPFIDIPFDVRHAIQQETSRGLKRARARQAIERGYDVKVDAKALVKKPDEICDRCPMSMSCAVYSLSSPEDCLTLGLGINWTTNEKLVRQDNTLACRPLKIEGNTVTVESRRLGKEVDVHVDKIIFD